MANGDNSLPTWQNPQLLNEWPQGQAPSPVAPADQTAQAPQAPAPSTATPPDPASNTASSIVPSGFGQSPYGPGAQTVPPPYQGPALRGGPVKNALTRFFYGAGQAMLAHVGMPTDYDIQQRNFQQQLQANEENLRQAQFAWQQSQIPVMTPYGIMNMPLAVAQKMGPAWAQMMGRQSAAAINKELMITPQGLYRTGLFTGQQPGLVPGTQTGALVDDELIGQYPELAPMKGQIIKPMVLMNAVGKALETAPIVKTGVQNLATAQGVVQAPTYQRTQRVLPATIARPADFGTAAPSAAGGGVPAAAIQQMPSGSPGRQAVTSAGRPAPTVVPLQTPQGGPVMSPAAWNEYDNKYLQPANAVEKSYQMMNNAYQQYETAHDRGQTLPTGAQSMVALSQHLATTFGGVKGARITKDMIAEHLGARSISDDALVAFQKLTNGDPLSPDQWTAFHDLIGQSRNLQWQQAAQYGNARGFDITNYLPSDLRNLASPPGGRTDLPGGGVGLQIQRDANGRIIGVK